MASDLLSPQEYANAMMLLLKNELILSKLLSETPARSALTEVVAEGLGLNAGDLDDREVAIKTVRANAGFAAWEADLPVHDPAQV